MEIPVLDGTRHASKIDNTILDALHGLSETIRRLIMSDQYFRHPMYDVGNTCYLFPTPLVIHQECF